MLKFCANLSMLFTEVGFLDRFEAAARAGFTAVECQFPYEFDRERLAGAVHENRLSLILYNLPGGDWEAGERGIACHPDRVAEFRDGVGRAIEYAEAVGCRRLNCLAGIAPDGADPDLVRATLVGNVVFAAEQLGRAGIQLLLEPINSRDVPGFYIDRPGTAVEILEAAAPADTALQLDLYHAAMMDEDPRQLIERHIGRIGHFQVADAPGRHEPGTGEIDYESVFRLIDESGYDGWIGCEYIPLGGTVDGLVWMAPYR